LGGDPTSAGATFAAAKRLTGVEQQVPDTRLWMVAFLGLAFAMVAVAVAWLAVGPPIR
jgi:hypothetical protein